MGKNNKQRREFKKRNRERRRKEIKKSYLNKRDEPLAPKLELAPNPFSGMSKEDRNNMIQEIAKNSLQKYQVTLDKVKEIARTYDPLYLLSVMSSYGLCDAVGDNGIQTRDSDHPIYQHHIELLQGIVLQIQAGGRQSQYADPHVIQELWTALKELIMARSFIDMEKLCGEVLEENAVYLLQHQVRGSTQTVRNWGYLSQVKKIARELYGHFDGLLEKTYGYTASNVIDLFSTLLSELGKALQKRHETLRSLYRVKDNKELVMSYYELIGAASSDADEFMQHIDIASMPFKSLFLMLLAHYDLRLHEIYEFTPRQLSNQLGIDDITVKKILDEFSLEWGSLESHELEHLFLSNPIWLRPIIKIETDKYYCAMPQVFFSFIIPSLDRLVELIDRKALSERRAKYLEEKIVQIVKTRFPESNTVSCVKWKDAEIEYETDLIATIDSHIIIAEAKSGNISNPALRGAPARLKKHIEEILIAPNLQSKRLKNKLEEIISNQDWTDKLCYKLPTDIKNIHKIIRVSVSLEDFGSLQANVASLKETKWLPNDFDPCPTMNLADFETLFDFLEHPIQIVHYLERRQELEETIGYMGDELDLMGFYIGTLFNLGYVSPEEEFFINGMSHPLDAYYNSRDIGIDIPKPQPKISPLFSAIMEQLEKRETPRWTEIGVILNRFSPDDQRKLARMIQDLKKNVRKYGMIDGHKNMAICVPSKPSRYSIGYVLYNSNNAHRRNEFIQTAAMHGLKADHITQCLVIAKDIDKDDNAYHFIGLVEQRGDK